MNVGERLKRLRISNGLSQEELGKVLNEDGLRKLSDYCEDLALIDKYQKEEDP